MSNYKAKRIDTQEWVSGFLYKDENCTFIIPDNIAAEYSADTGCLTVSAHEVASATLCEFVDRWVDKESNSVEIWENDVWKIEYNDKKMISHVERGLGGFQFTVEPETGKDFGVCYDISSVDILECLGNVIDNPELV